MKLLFLVVDLNSFGGGERMAVHLAFAMRRLNWRAEVLSIQKLDGDLPFDKEGSLKPYSLGIDLYSGGAFKRVLSKIRSLLRFRGFTFEGDWDAVIAIGTYPSVIASTISKQKILTVGSEHASMGVTPLIWRIFRRYTYPHLDHLVVLTERSKVAAEGLNSRIQVIPNFCDCGNAQHGSWKNRRILGIGRFDKNKNFGVLVDAFSRAHDKYPQWRLHLMGNGPERLALEKKVRDLGLEKSVTIRGAVQDIGSEYAAASIVALTSRSEGLPMVLLEASCHGLPCIAFDCETGPAEIIRHQISGFLVQPGNVEEFSERLSQIMGDAELWTRLSLESQQTSSLFSKERICKKWVELLSDSRSAN